MDPSVSAIVKILLPRLPLILKTAILNAFALSPNSSKQDMKTELAVVVLRSILSIKKPLGYIQKIGLKDTGIKGPLWISQVAFAAQGVEVVRDALVRAISDLGDGSEKYDLPEVVDVEGEWTGHRSGVNKHAPRPDISEMEQYDSLMREVESPVTILYFHGGAYFLMDPSSHRATTSQLAKMTKGRCFSVRYRLAPQNPFPAALLDALIAYLSLLSPAPDAFHDPVPAQNIVFAGDSAGGNLSLVLMQMLLTLQRGPNSSVRFNGRDVKIEVPAGVAVNSPWCDISRSLPSVCHNARYDYISPPSATGVPEEPSPDKIWPTNPPRAEIFCTASALTHPMVSPLAATVDQWKGACPVYLCCGNEGLEDEICIIARKIYRAGSTVIFDGYEGMPHCFSMLFPNSGAGAELFKSWSNFSIDAVFGKLEVKHSGRWMKAFLHPPEFTEIAMDDISLISDSKAAELMMATKRKAMKREQGAIENWKSIQSKPRL